MRRQVLVTFDDNSRAGTGVVGSSAGEHGQRRQVEPQRRRRRPRERSLPDRPCSPSNVIERSAPAGADDVEDDRPFRRAVRGAPGARCPRPSASARGCAPRRDRRAHRAHAARGGCPAREPRDRTLGWRAANASWTHRRSPRPISSSCKSSRVARRAIRSAGDVAILGEQVRQGHATPGVDADLHEHAGLVADVRRGRRARCARRAAAR